jgi:hypothetical protein
MSELLETRGIIGTDQLLVQIRLRVRLRVRLRAHLITKLSEWSPCAQIKLFRAVCAHNSGVRGFSSKLAIVFIFIPRDCLSRSLHTIVTLENHRGFALNGRLSTILYMRSSVVLHLHNHIGGCRHINPLNFRLAQSRKHGCTTQGTNCSFAEKEGIEANDHQYRLA